MTMFMYDHIFVWPCFWKYHYVPSLLWCSAVLQRLSDWWTTCSSRWVGSHIDRCPPLSNEGCSHSNAICMEWLTQQYGLLFLTLIGSCNIVLSGQAMKPVSSYFTSLIDSLKKLYVTKVTDCLHVHVENIHSIEFAWSSSYTYLLYI